MAAVVNPVLFWGQWVWHSKFSRWYAIGPYQLDAVSHRWPLSRTQALRARRGHSYDFPAVFRGDREVWFIRGTVEKRESYTHRLTCNSFKLTSYSFAWLFAVPVDFLSVAPLNLQYQHECSPHCSTHISYGAGCENLFQDQCQRMLCL